MTALTVDQQVRLIAAEIAMKTRQPTDSAENTISDAEAWLRYLNTKSPLVQASVVDIARAK